MQIKSTLKRQKYIFHGNDYTIFKTDTFELYIRIYKLKIKNGKYIKQFTYTWDLDYRNWGKSIL